MLDVRDILAADRAIALRGGESAAAAFLVGTASHCHGALRRIVLGQGSDGSPGNATVPS
jgi:hypothetical protein